MNKEMEFEWLDDDITSSKKSYIIQCRKKLVYTFFTFCYSSLIKLKIHKDWNCTLWVNWKLLRVREIHKGKLIHCILCWQTKVDIELFIYRFVWTHGEQISHQSGEARSQTALSNEAKLKLGYTHCIISPLPVPARNVQKVSLQQYSVIYN